MNPVQTGTDDVRALCPDDMQRIVAGIPLDLRDLMRMHPTLTLAGGAIRALVSGTPVSDFDFFLPAAVSAGPLAHELKRVRETCGSQTRLYESPNAITVLTAGRIPVQFITRWRFAERAAILAAFDFTIAQACVWRATVGSESRWRGLCTQAFYPDLAARRLVYTAPVRDEDACGSLLRMRKFLANGYTIQADSLAKTVARAVMGAKLGIGQTEAEVAQALAGAIREVDPLQVVDNVDIVDEHEIG